MYKLCLFILLKFIQNYNFLLRKNKIRHGKPMELCMEIPFSSEKQCRRLFLRKFQWGMKTLWFSINCYFSFRFRFILSTSWCDELIIVHIGLWFEGRDVTLPS